MYPFFLLCGVSAQQTGKCYWAMFNLYYNFNSCIFVFN